MSIQLVDLYTDAFENSKNISVYANGKMQVIVYVAVRFSSSSFTHEAVIKDVQDNARIYYEALTSLELVMWAKSNVSNMYRHSICDANTKRSADHAIVYMDQNIRVPLYITFPKTSAVTGTHRWVVKYKGATSPLNNPVKIDVQSYINKVKPEDVEIVDLESPMESFKFRVLRYKHNAEDLPNGAKLMRYIGNDGIRYVSSPECTWPYKGPEWHDFTGPWLPLVRQSGDKNALGAFVDFLATSVRIMPKNNSLKGFHYIADERIEIFKDGKKPSLLAGNGTYRSELSSDHWETGIVMVLATDTAIGVLTGDGHYYDLSYVIYDKFKVEDNFGNEFLVKIDFNANEEDDGYYRKWEVTEFEDA